MNFLADESVDHPIVTIFKGGKKEGSLSLCQQRYELAPIASIFTLTIAVSHDICT